MQIDVLVKEKVATAMGAPVIVCGNSDYKVTFHFDDEWTGLEVKTARFVFRRGGKIGYIDVVFSGVTCDVPVLTDLTEVYIGVYAGELRTSTPVSVPCKKSVLCKAGSPEPPPEDVYAQLMKYFADTEYTIKRASEAADACEEITPQAVKATDAANTAAERAEGAARGVVTIEQNSNTALKFWVGSQEEYDALETKEAGCFYIVSDDKVPEELLGRLKGHDDEIAQLQTHLTEPVIWVDDSTQAETKLQELFKKMPDTTFARYCVSTNGSYSVFELSKATNGWGHMERINYDARWYRTVRGKGPNDASITYTFEPWIQFAPVEPSEVILWTGVVDTDQKDRQTIPLGRLINDCYTLLVEISEMDDTGTFSGLRRIVAHRNGASFNSFNGEDVTFGEDGSVTRTRFHFHTSLNMDNTNNAVFESNTGDVNDEACVRYTLTPNLDGGGVDYTFQTRPVQITAIRLIKY